MTAEDFRTRMEEIRRFDEMRQIEGAHREEDSLLRALLDAAIDEGTVPSWIRDARDEMEAYQPRRWYA